MSFWNSDEVERQRKERIKAEEQKKIRERALAKKEKQKEEKRALEKRKKDEERRKKIDEEYQKNIAEMLGQGGESEEKKEQKPAITLNRGGGFGFSGGKNTSKTRADLSKLGYQGQQEREESKKPDARKPVSFDGPKLKRPI